MSVTVTQHPVNLAYYAKNTVPAFIIQTTEAVTIVVKHWDASDYTNFSWIDADIVFQGSYAPDFNGKVTVDFSDCYAAYVKTAIPSASATEISQTNATRCFRANVYDSGGNSVSNYTWFVANALLKSSTPYSEWSQANFLTNQPLEKVTNYVAPEWLTYLVLGNGGTKLKVRFYKKSGGNVEYLIRSNNVAGCFSVDVSYKRLIQLDLVNMLPNSLLGYYDVILFDSGDNEMCRQRYIYEERSGMEKYYCFVNALGGIDTLICPGDNVLQPETTHNVGRFNNKYTALDDTDNIRQWSQNTGMMPNKYCNWIFELLTAKQGAEKYDPAAQDYYEIVVNSSEIAMGDHGQLASATFGYILNDPVNVMRDTERAVDRSLHQSVADEAEELEDLTVQVTLAMSPITGGSGVETEVATISATKLYVEWLTGDVSIPDKIYYSIDGKLVGDFTPGVDDMPFIITKGTSETIQFSTQDAAVAAIIVKYYPSTVQTV